MRRLDHDGTRGVPTINRLHAAGTAGAVAGDDMIGDALLSQP